MDKYEPCDQEKWLGPPPWSPSDPRLQSWESAHGHDPRLKCLPEFGCQVELDRLESADRKLAKIRELHGHVIKGVDGVDYCLHCDCQVPCSTQQILDEEDASDP